MAVLVALVGCTQIPIPVPPVVEPWILAFEADADQVAAGTDVALTWVVEGADTLTLEPGDVDVTGLELATVRVDATTTFTLRASNAAGEDTAVVEVRVEPVPEAIVRPLLVAGQSNAQGVNLAAAEALTYVTADEGVFMLGNDDEWKVAYEPLDDCTGQVDYVSLDPGGDPANCIGKGNSGVSMGVAFGNALTSAIGDEAVLVPAARGGSGLASADDPRHWEPPAVRDDRTTLFGSAVRRWRLADSLGASAAHGALFWYQGESEATSQRYPLFQSRTDAVFDAFEEETGAPIIFAQLARTVDDEDPEARNLLFQQVRERQRTLETASRMPAGAPSTAAKPQRFMVVTHDLPLFDEVHLSAAAQLELGRRVALAFRDHVVGEAIDGTGPRLVRVDHAAGEPDVYVRFDMPVTAPQTPTAAAYAGYFQVLEGAFEGAAQLEIDSIDLAAGDPATVRIRLAAPASSGVAVRYMPPATMTTTDVGIEVDVIRAATCAEPMPETQVCLPAPAFGDAMGSVAPEALNLPALFDE